ncbi:hypothetical protein [Microlunatus parietis]|nr:hypothetical protein [Microlunatus parietis]
MTGRWTVGVLSLRSSGPAGTLLPMAPITVVLLSAERRSRAGLAG